MRRRPSPPWSIPPLPNRFLGFPARTQFLAEDAAGMPWEGEFDQAILDIPLGVGPYLEYAFFHKPARTLLVTDILVRVPRDPPRVNAEHGLAALLNRAKNDSKDVVPDTPEGRRIGWQKTVLFAFFLQPGFRAFLDSSFGMASMDGAIDGIAY